MEVSAMPRKPPRKKEEEKQINNSALLCPDFVQTEVRDVSACLHFLWTPSLSPDPASFNDPGSGFRISASRSLQGTVGFAPQTPKGVALAWDPIRSESPGIVMMNLPRFVQAPMGGGKGGTAAQSRFWVVFKHQGSP